MNKKCSRCKRFKLISTEFYSCRGKPRGECKKCTIKRNVAYQKASKSWRQRYADKSVRLTYMRDYYSKNKEKFAEYRKKRREKFPHYHRDYKRLVKATLSRKRVRTASRTAIPLRSTS